MGAGLVAALIVYLIFGKADYAFYSLVLAPFWKGLVYTFIKPCRLYFEVQAFAKQISLEAKEHRAHYIKAYAKSLAEDYNFSISEEDAAQKLRKRIK
jgi:hypothetical protein